MNRTYDIFEIMPDGAPMWRATVPHHEDALHKLTELAALTQNEMRLMHLPSNTLIAAINTPKP
jgi:hypothetical protein